MTSREVVPQQGSPPPSCRPGAEESAAPRVVMIVERLYELGGAQKQALRLCRALAGLGVDARIVTGRWRRSNPRRGEVEGVPVAALFTCFKMFNLRGLRKLSVPIYVASLALHLRRHRGALDVIHAHSATSSAYAAVLAGRWLAKPTVMKVMASGNWSDFKRMRARKQFPSGDWMLRRLRGIDRVVCLNHEVEEECLGEGFSAEQLVSIPNGFPVREVSPMTEYSAGNTVEITFVGRLDAQKNPSTLLEAAARVIRSAGGHRFRVRFLGDGPQRGDLEKRALELGLGGRVRFVGRVENVAERLRETHIFVLPSLSEGLSNALLEAMAHGLPCIATAIPGNVDLIRDRETGILVKPSDPEDLARAILELAGSPDLRGTLGRAGRAFVEGNHDMEAVARRYLDLYRSLVGRR